MSIEIKMDLPTYNGMYEIVNELTGKAAIAATSLQESIQREANANVVDVPATETTEARKDLPQSITLEIKESILNGIFTGLQEKVADDKISVSNMKKFIAVAGILKMKGRMETYLETLCKDIPTDQDFDADEPFDG